MSKNTLPLLEVRNISKSFPGVKALQNVSLTVNEEECLGLIGENGAGKSTLIKILSGAIMKDEGEVWISGEKVEIHNPSDGLKAGVSVIYQEMSLVRQLTAVENVFLGRWKKDKAGLVDWKGLRKEVEDLYKSINLSINLDLPVEKLSTAQCQLIEISRAVFLNSRIIIMDEPTSSLTNKEVEVLFDLIKKLKAKGISIIYVTHKLEELFRVCDRVEVMKDGCNVGEFDIKITNKEQLVQAMIGRELKNYYPQKNYKHSEKIIFEAKNINWENKVKDVSFKVREGEILGFAGLVGAGRTETMRAIFGAEQDATGQVLINGREVNIKSPKDAINSGIAYVPEDRRYQSLVLLLSVAYNIPLAKFQSVCNGKFGIIDLKKERKIAEGYRTNLKIKTSSVKQQVGQLSGGNQQKVVVAKWLNTDAKVFIFDEPTRGIDIGSKAEIYQLICDLAAKGAAIIVVSSELPEILGISDRVIVMHEGKIAAEFDIKEATEENIMVAAIGGGK